MKNSFLLSMIFINPSILAESDDSSSDKIEISQYQASGHLLSQGYKAKDKSGKYTIYVGKWTVYYDTGEVLGIRTFESGIPEGYEKYFYKNGRLSSEVMYIHGLRQGPAHGFFENGPIFTMEIFKNDKVDGEFKEFWNTGELSRWGIYSEGRSLGPVFSREGTKGTVHKFLDVNGTGVYMYWFSNGKIHSIAHYEYGHLNGVIKEFNEDGHLSRETTFVNGYEKGIRKDYDVKGHEVSEKKIDLTPTK
jgi:antitoxin component YwqK of YwqJK toxin-antitoxin module